MEEIKIPFILGGELIDREDDKEEINFHNKKIKINIPKLSKEDFEKIKQTKEVSDSLHELSSDEIISFLQKVREKWKKGNKLRDMAQEYVQESTGYSKEMVDFALQQIEDFLSEDYLNLLLESELGNKKLVDNWLVRGEAYVHCQPKGAVLHILAGNAPVISVVSLLRGLLTKNISFLKMASEDLVTLSHFVQTFREVDPEHPITKSVSVVYWKHSNTDLLGRFIEISDILCVWGGGDAVQTIKDHSAGKEVLEFGPRRGIQLIGKEVFSDKESLKEAAKKAAHDLVIFDQEACFSPQICFIEGSKEDAKKFSEKLENALLDEGSKLPKGIKSLQHSASIGHMKSYSNFLGNEIFHSKNKDYMLIITEKIKHTKSHPLGRTLFVIPVSSFDEILEEFGSETQVVAVEPFSRAYKLRETLTRNGVDRITHLGKMPYFAAGAPHDGIYPLARLVRWVKSR